MTPEDVKMLDELEAAVQLMTPGDWTLAGCSSGGLILSRERCTLDAAYQQSVQIVPSTDAIGIALLRNNALRLIELARKGAESE